MYRGKEFRVTYVKMSVSLFLLMWKGLLSKLRCHWRPGGNRKLLWNWLDYYSNMQNHIMRQTVALESLFFLKPISNPNHSLNPRPPDMVQRRKLLGEISFGSPPCIGSPFLTLLMLNISRLSLPSLTSGPQWIFILPTGTQRNLFWQQPSLVWSPF